MSLLLTLNKLRFLIILFEPASACYEVKDVAVSSIIVKKFIYHTDSAEMSDNDYMARNIKTILY